MSKRRLMAIKSISFGVLFWLILPSPCAKAQSWIQLSPPSSPSPTTQHTAVYDPSSNRMIVYGGYNGSAFWQDFGIWVLTGANGFGPSNWTQLTASGSNGSPPARRSHTSV